MKRQNTITPKDLEFVRVAVNRVLEAVCFGDHGNIKDRAYICLAYTSPEIQNLAKACNMLNTKLP